MLVNKKEKLKQIEGLKTRKLISGGVCGGLLILLLRAGITYSNGIYLGQVYWQEEEERIGEHLFTDYLLPFELVRFYH